MSANQDAKSHSLCHTAVTQELVAGLVFVGSVLMFTLLSRVPLALAALAGLWVLVFSVPGVWITRAVLRTPVTPLALVVVGATAGQAAGRLLLVLVDTLLASSRAVAFAMVGALLLAALTVPPVLRTIRFDSDDKRDVRWIFGLSAAVVLIAAVVYAFVGRLTERGYAFIPYFSLDFLQHTAVTSELSRTGPAMNVFFFGQPLHYYWMYHSWPASLVALTGLRAQHAVTSTIPFVALQFVGVLVLLTRASVSAAARYGSVAIALFAPSFIGVLALVRMLLPRIAEMVPVVTTDRSYSFLSHSWLRDVLYEPHALTALTLTASSYVLARHVNFKPRPVIAGLCGFMAGSALLTDAFIGAVAIAWGLVWLCVGAARQRISLKAAAAFIGLVGLWALAGLGLGIFPVDGGVAVLGLHPAIRYAPLYLGTELGALGVLGVTGMSVAFFRRRHDPAELWPWAALLVLSLIFAFGVIVPTELNAALRKGIKVLQFSMLAFCPVGIDWLTRPGRNRGVQVLAIALVALAATTTFSDTWLHTIGGLEKPGTRFITSDEMQALEWIRQCTPTSAVLQDVSQVRPERHFPGNRDLLIPALAERRVLWSNYHHPYILQVPEGDVRSRQSALESVFASRSATSLSQELNSLHLDYLYVDRREPGPHLALADLTAHGDLGAPVCFGSVCIIAVSPSAKLGGTTCRSGS